MSNEKRIMLAESSLLLGEAVRYKVFPRFKHMFQKHTDTKNIEKTLNSLETYRDAKGEDLWKDRTTVWKVIRTVLQWVVDGFSALYLPFAVFIVPIIFQVVFSILRYAIQINEVDEAKKEALQVLRKLRELDDKIKDPKAKAKISKDIKKLEDILKKVDYKD
jgi:hypothetical protein